MGKSYSLDAAKPYRFTFEVERIALVIIDVQKDFVDPDGFGAIQCGSEEVFASVRDVVPRIKKVLDISRDIGLHVFHTREGHEADLSDLASSKRDRQVNSPNGHHTLGIGEKGPMGRLLVRGEEGHGIVEELAPVPGEVVVDKPGKGSFWGTDFHRKLMARGITHLLFCGVTTECCVTTTVREANDRGYECCILEDCTGGFNEDFVTNSLGMISAYDGLFGYTAHSSQLLSQTAPVTPPESPSLNPESNAFNKSMDLRSLKQQYKQGTVDPRTLVGTIFDRIQAYQLKDPSVWIFLRQQADVMKDAIELTSRWAGKALPPLYGIPFAVKDNIDVAGMTTTVACAEYAYIAQDTAPVVAALLAAGAILIGKTNMDQFATGLSGCRSPHGSPRSVYGGGSYISGGSSSGSGVSVAADLVSFSLGTDTAGSGRVPAAFNGIVGFKPTKGTLSARGVVPACRSLDTLSIFAHTTNDARAIWQIADCYDPEDSYAKLPSTLPLLASEYRGVKGAGFTFAIPPTSALKACSEAFQKLFASSIATVTKTGGRLQPLSEEEYAPFKAASDLLYTGSLVYERIASIGPAFIDSNLTALHPTTRALFTSVSQRPPKPWQIFEDQMKQATYTRQVQQLFAKKIDVLLLPTVPFHPTLEQMEKDPIGLNAQMGVFTHFANVLDLCAVSLNAGFYEGVGGEGMMPFGVQLVCGSGLDGKVFDIAKVVEGAFEEGVVR
ncbi:hypothetical protein EG328_011982 [Venturia inaequalis]|uniref:Amidase signature enzyme n=1 Tax=Venturia inaequalis TaxID=5025 RepID=A0A8H3VQ19_VENIN|nr:hypothetical protein EG328_011982 [Venturia inaequalis]KAE9993269.1 hypothetical protein EG327_005876 [Venturia inaequalis]